MSGNERNCDFLNMNIGTKLGVFKNKSVFKNNK